MGSFRPDEEKKKPETQEERLKRYRINFHPRIDSQKSRKLCVDIKLSLSQERLEEEERGVASARGTNIRDQSNSQVLS